MDKFLKVTEDQLDIFDTPARIIVAGYSNSGKSELVKKIIKKYHHKFNDIIICGIAEHSLQKDPHIGRKLSVYPHIINPLSEVNMFDKGNILYILDDIFLEAVENKHVVDAFTKGRHLNISTIFITQNLFFSGKYARNISLNCSHYILLKQRDLNQVQCLGRQLYGSSKAKEFVEIYKKCLQYQSYGYLLVDLGIKCSEDYQFRTNIVGEPPCELVLQW